MELTLFLVVLTVSQGQSEASERAVSAYISQNKIDTALDNYVRTLTTEQQRKWVGNAVLVGRAAVERKLTVKWSF